MTPPLTQGRLTGHCKREETEIMWKMKRGSLAEEERRECCRLMKGGNLRLTERGRGGIINRILSDRRDFGK